MKKEDVEEKEDDKDVEEKEDDNDEEEVRRRKRKRIY